LVLRLLSGAPKSILGDFLQFQLIYNSGAAFSIGTHASLLFSILAIIAIAGIFIFMKSLTSLPWAASMGLLLGGILGNLSDRLFRAPYFLRGEVIDWIKIPHWPVFNLADTSIVISAGTIALLTLTNVKPRTFDDR
jgi:signal peptidase II